MISYDVICLFCLERNALFEDKVRWTAVMEEK